MILHKCLQKDPRNRYQDAAGLIGALRSVSRQDAPGSQAKATLKARHPSIAVLPFVDMSPQKDQEYFCDGIAEELINALTHIRDLRVVARTSAFAFKGKNIDVREIGNTLSVDSVLEGSIRKAGTKLRVTAQLISIEDGYHLWSEKFDREMEDIFAIQDEISTAIVDNLKIELLADERTVELDPAMGLAYFHAGMSYYQKNLMDKAISAFQKSRELAAYSGWAESYLRTSSVVAARRSAPLYNLWTPKNANGQRQY